jgi:peptide/nickel transport system ATP-binding protein
MTAQLCSTSTTSPEFATRRGIVKAVQHVNSPSPRRDARHRRRSGSGKSVTSYAVMRIIDRAGKIAKAR